MLISNEDYNEILSTMNDNLSILRNVLKSGRIHDALDIIDSLIEENENLMAD